MLYHRDEKSKIFDSKPIYESCQATIDIKCMEKPCSGAESSKAKVSDITPSSLSELSQDKPKYRLMASILGLDALFYQR